MLAILGLADCLTRSPVSRPLSCQCAEADDLAAGDSIIGFGGSTLACLGLARLIVYVVNNLRRLVKPPAPCLSGIRSVLLPDQPDAQQGPDWRPDYPAGQGREQS